MTRRLIVNADDLGLRADVDAGIVQAHREGVLTAASWLAGGASAESAVKTAPASLDVGLHLALNDVAPCGPTYAFRRLLVEGRFPRRYPRTVRWLLSTAGSLKTVEEEWRAQFEAFRDAWGGSPSHVDSHQHIAALPGLQSLYVRLAAEYGATYVRIPCESTRGTADRRLGAVILCSLSAMLKRSVSRHGLLAADHFVGFGWSGRFSEAEAALLPRVLKAGMTELMVHPGTVDEFAGYHRRTEMNTLMEHSLRQALDLGNIYLTTFRESS